jgi:hypothetical protein
VKEGYTKNFAKAQVALFRAGIDFVHLAPDEKRRKAAEIDFLSLLTAEERAKAHKWHARFMGCVFNGEASEHVPVLFIQDEADCEPRALREALHIPAPIDGVGPCIVRSPPCN